MVLFTSAFSRKFPLDVVIQYTLPTIQFVYWQILSVVCVGKIREMALHRTSLTRRGSKNENTKEDEEVDNNGYIQVLVKPLEQGNYSLLLNWMGINETNLPTQHLGVVYGSALIVLSFVIYQILRCDMGVLFQRLCSVLVPMFTIICAFYWLSLYLRKTWSTTSVYLLFCACFAGETIAQILVSRWGAGRDEIDGSHVTKPLVLFIVLIAICGASLFSSLETTHSAFVISLVSFSRFLTCSTIGDLPYALRPYIGYACGLAGFVVSKYMETVLKPPINNFMTHDGKIPVIKRRRSSSSGAHAFSAHRSTRRTSLPALIPKIQVGSLTKWRSGVWKWQNFILAQGQVNGHNVLVQR